ncbi:hypothetical protein [Phenylobacterium sp.]|uniref:hypothetical protein n=1 Tax=Phenylobacterium sp. TaxID=1871053 RepID=UPI002730272C|nr:hypothetical protein [Phenylobacterium sp.]MDP1618703.1 hypothetical protein [Phenylobacterium sp.]MDP1986033.1 hypothetical protein [Phenylobacterium sp.]
MTSMNRARLTGLAAAAGLGLALAACGQGETTQAGDRLDGAAAPTYPGEGAAGLVDNESGAMTEAPGADAAGGGTGQTPGYGEPGGAPSEAHSDMSSPPSVAENPPPN